MLLSQSEYKDEIHSMVVEELRGIGIKYRNDKKTHKSQNTNISKKLFGVSLHRLELKDVILSNGNVVTIPHFVAECCDRILENVATEGIFRKTGNLRKQKEIKLGLEKGFSLDKFKPQTLDIACLLKTFFRELPEPIISGTALQDTFIKCLLPQSDDVKIEGLLMTCLLLPPLNLNTLAYFLQFLKTVSSHSNQNRMTVQNLSVLWSENLMPIPLHPHSNRLTSHHKVIEMLIENSSQIGIIPDRFLKRLEDNLSMTPNQSSILHQTVTDKKKKKVRRSASLTRVFHGIKKAWNGAIGSSESLDKSTEFPLDETTTTPCITKSTKKRKITENLTSFSAKKKKDVLSFMPQHDLLPKTPHNQKEFKKTRLSLGTRKFGSKNSDNSGEPSERRWSIVGANWKHKKHGKKSKGEIVKMSPVQSLPNLVSSVKIIEEEESERAGMMETTTDDEDYVKVPKSEFEAVIERVSAIETRISQEFNSVKLDSLKTGCDSNSLMFLDGPEKVVDKYNQTLLEVGTIDNNDEVNGQISKRLSRELKIRRSAEGSIMRSPSARKIGAIRRKSKEGVRLSRNQSHLGSSKINMEDSKPASFYPKSNLRRGRPNTVQSGLKHAPAPSTSVQIEQDDWTSGERFFNNSFNDRREMSPEEAPEKSNDAIDENVFKTPNARMKNLSIKSTVKQSVAKTPMLPPALPPQRTPISTAKQSVQTPFSKTPIRLVDIAINRNVLTPGEDFSQGRASIARIRTQNAGMVMQKAKLFNDMGKDGEKITKPTATRTSASGKLYVTRIDVEISSHKEQQDKVEKIPNSPPINVVKPIINKKLENVKKCDPTPTKSPRKRNNNNNNNSPRSPSGVNRRQNLRKTQSPYALKTVKDRVSRIDNTENRFKNKVSLLNQELLEEICMESAEKTESSSFPVIRKPLVLAQNSPRRLVKTPAKDRMRTPLKAAHGFVNVRHSPRLSSLNRKSLKYTY